MSSARQSSFSGGEIAPVLWSRVDHTKYASGLKTNRNSIITRSGAWMNRPGTEFCGEVKDPANNHRLIPFEFSISQSYCILLGDKYAQFYNNGNPILESPVAITSIHPYNQGSNNIITAANSYNVGDLIYITGVSAPYGNFLNNRFFLVYTDDGTSITLATTDGLLLNTLGWGSWVSGGQMQRVYTVVTPYVSADLSLIKFDQSGDVVTFTHENYKPATLSRFSDTNWTYSIINFVPRVTPYGVFNLEVTENGSGGNGIGSDNIYKVTTVNLQTGEESFPGASSTNYSVSAVTFSNPCELTYSPSRALNNGDEYLISMPQVPELDAKVFNITNIDNTHIYLNGVDSTNYTNPGSLSGAGMHPTAVKASPTAIPSITNPTILTFVNGWPGGFLPYNYGYNIYASIGGVFGFIGTAPAAVGTETVTFKDTGIVPDTSQQPPSYNPLFLGTGNYPSNCCFYQSRQCFSGSINQPEYFWASQINFYNNFSYTQPVQDSDTVIFQLPSTKVAIMNMVDIGNLVIFTETDERIVMGNNTGGQYGTLTPSEINVTVQSFWGATPYVRPVTIDGSALFVQRSGNIIRDLRYNFEEDKYKGNDLTVFATHLFDPYTIVDMDYQKVPNSVLWVVRNDGTLLNCTISREQQIIAWGHCDTYGKFLNVVCIPENNYESIYVLVRRQVINETGANTERIYVERFQNRIVEVFDVPDSIYMDSTGTYNGANTTSVTAKISTSGAWTKTNLLTVTFNGQPITLQGNQYPVVGGQIFITDTSGNIVRITVKTADNIGFIYTGYSDCDIPSNLQNTATTSWSIASNVLTGLWWMNGCQVSITGDGYVVASPNNSEYSKIVVSNGTVTLPKPYSVINVGHSYISDLKTLDLDVVGYSVFMGQTAADKWKNVSELTIQFVNSRGGFCGSATPETESSNSENNPLFKLSEVKPRSYTDIVNLPPPLITDNIKITVEGGWDIHGNVFFRQVDPLPVCISSIAYAGDLPLRQQEQPPQGVMGGR